MTPGDAVRCPDCGTDILCEPGMPGLCPQCLLSLALRESPRAGSDDSSDPGEAHTIDRPAPGRILGERYQIRELLGRGGMGEVFRAFDLKLRVDVALKAVRAEKVESERARELLRREVRSAREVVSPNVCRIFDLVAEDGQELVSMEYVDGETLADTLSERGPLALAEAREIAAQFLSGLDAIHQAGLVHRDFKPENVMRPRAGRVVVMDFGLARADTDRGAGTVAGTPAYMAPEQARGDSVDARADVYSAGVVLAEMLSVGGLGSGDARQALWRAARETPPRVPDGPWAAVLRQALAPNPSERPASARALARALEEATRRQPGFEGERPYPGLASVTEADAQYFFGRELEVEAVFGKLKRPRLLALLGPSGAGKSSFLRAGLLPVLPASWTMVITTPGTHPFQALAQELLPHFTHDMAAMQEFLRFEQPDVAVGLVTRWRRRHEHALLIVDQFEELFTQNPKEVQAAFASLLGRLVLEADAHVVVSMRDDFLIHCHGHEALAPAFSDLTPLGPLGESALRRALVQPALACGYRFEDEALVEEMVDAVRGERGALPLLAFAASRLWDLRDRERGLLTREAYRQIGGVAGALAQHAEATLERIGASRTPLVRELFRNLVTAQGTRAVRERDELLSLFEGTSASDGGGRAEAEAVLKTLVDARLLTSYERTGEAGESRHQVEIVHESLLSAWPRLVRWRTQDADGAQLRDQLRQAAQLWDEKGRSAELLWSGAAYEEFRLWRERYAGSLSAIESDYARAMVDRERRRKRRLRLAVGAAFAALTAVAVAIGLSRQQAVKALERAEASRLLAIGELRIRDDPTEALAFAAASLARADSPEARTFAMKALWEAPPAVELAAPGSVVSPEFSPDGERLAAGGFAADVRVWSADGRGPVVLPGHVSSGRGGIQVEWATNDWLLTGAAEGVASEVHLWSVREDGRRMRTIDLGGPSWWFVGSRRLMVETPSRTLDGGRLLRAWALPDGEPQVLGRDVSAKGFSWTFFAPDASHWFYEKGRDIRARPLPIGAGPDRLFARLEAKSAVGYVLKDPDRVCVADATGRTYVWLLAEKEPSSPRIIPRPQTAPAAIALDPTEHWLRSWPQVDQQVRLWSVNQWPAARPLALRRNLPWFVSNAVFHPSGQWIAASTGQGTRLTLWPLRRPYPSVVDGYVDAVRSVAFSPDGQWLATSWADKRLRLWPLTDRGVREVRSLDPSPSARVWRSIIFDPRGRYLIAPGGGGIAQREAGAWVFPLDGSKARLLACSTRASGFNSAAISPSGRFVATANFFGSGERRLCAWDVETGRLRHFELPEPGRVDSSASQAPTGYERGVQSLAFAGESTILTAGDGGLRRWNLETGAHELLAAAAPGYSLEAAFSADARVALTWERRLDKLYDCRQALLHDLSNGTSRPVTELGPCRGWRAALHLDPTGTVAVAAGDDGIVRVAKLAGGEPHLLVGHKGMVDRVAISPDLRWVATSGEDNTLRLWPMPDLSKPPLHALPRAELLAKLRSLTNIRVELDSSAPEGWRLEVGPFPGWKTVSEW